MIHRFPILCAAALALTVGCVAGSDAPTGKGKDGGVVQQRLLAAFRDAADTAEAVRRAREAGLRTDDHGILVDIQTQGLTSDDRPSFDLEGVAIRHFSIRYERVSASVRDLSALHRLVDIGVVRMIAPEYGARDGSGDGTAY